MPRPKGSKNKQTRSSIEMASQVAARVGVDPFEILCMFAKGDWEGLGYESKCKTVFTPQGIEMEEDVIKPELRAQCAKDATKYLRQQLRALEVDMNGDLGIQVIVKDYLKK